MDNDFEKLLSFHINNEIKKHSAQKVISQEEFIKEVVQKTGLSEEKIKEFFIAFNKVIRELYKENPEGLKSYFREKYGADFIMFDT